MKHGSMTAVDKVLDSDPCANHEFLGQKDNLVEQKTVNPAMRLGKNNLLKNPEQVVVSEEHKQGLQAPKKQFMVLSAFEKRYGAPDPAQIKIMRIKGQDVKGVDVVDESQQGIYTYIDETSCAVQRQTTLSDSDLVVSANQSEVIFSSAVRHLNTAPKDDTNCVVIDSGSMNSSSASASTAGLASELFGGAAAATGEEALLYGRSLCVCHLKLFIQALFKLFW